MAWKERGGVAWGNQRREGRVWHGRGEGRVWHGRGGCGTSKVRDIEGKGCGTYNEGVWHEGMEGVAWGN